MTKRETMMRQERMGKGTVKMRKRKGMRTEGTEMRVEGTEMRVEGTEMRMEGTEMRMEETEMRMEGTEMRMEETEMRTEGTEMRTKGTEMRMEGTEMRTKGTEMRLEGLGLEMKMRKGTEMREVRRGRTMGRWPWVIMRTTIMTTYTWVMIVVLMSGWRLVG